jgi:Tfp pilus assembly protein FimV
VDRPGYDPGGDSTIPYETGPPADGAPSDGSGGDAAPLEREPVQDPDAPAAPLDGPDLQASPGAEATPVAPVDPPPSATAPPAQEGNGRGFLRDTEAAGSGSRHRHSLSLRAPAPERSVGEARDADASAPIQTNAIAAPAPEPSDVPAASPAPDIPQGARTHLVKEGESLWSIARGVLRPGASDAAVAREVARLWELNAHRIGTGDPDVLPTGTRLVLR